MWSSFLNEFLENVFPIELFYLRFLFAIDLVSAVILEKVNLINIVDLNVVFTFHEIVSEHDILR